MKTRLLLIAIGCILSVLSHARTTPPETVEMTGKTDIAGGVIHAETKKPIANVSITAYSTEKKEKITLTDANGNYNFNELKSGTYKLVFQKDGFKTITREKVSIREDNSSSLNIEMSEEKGFQILPAQLFFTDF